MKTAERAHTPKELWESVKLDPSYNKALEQIDAELQYWPKFLVHKCKQRFTRLRQILVKRRKIKLEGSAEYRVVSHKAERRERQRLVKVEKSAQIENQVRNGLLQNLKNDKYKDIYNIDQKEFERALETENVQDEEEDFVEEDYEPGYINDFSDEEGEDDEGNNEQEENEGKESDDDIDDIFNQKDKNKISDEEKSENDEDIKKNKKIGKKRKRRGIKYEFEIERENTNKNVNYNMNTNNINNLDDQDDYL